MMRRLLLMALVALAALVPGAAEAITIYPIDLAQILAGARFDLKVEWDGVVQAGDVTVTVNGAEPAQVLGGAPEFVPRERGLPASELVLREAALAVPGRYVVRAGLIGKHSHPLDWERAVMDTIILDQAVQAAKDSAAPRNDTLVLRTSKEND